jgi:hypothetical protein
MSNHYIFSRENILHLHTHLTIPASSEQYRSTTVTPHSEYVDFILRCSDCVLRHLPASTGLPNCQPPTYSWCQTPGSTTASTDDSASLSAAIRGDTTGTRIRPAFGQSHIHDAGRSSAILHRMISVPASVRHLARLLSRLVWPS